MALISLVIMSIKEKVRNRVRESRLALNLSQRELARLADVSRQSIISLERERLNPSIEVCLRIATVLNRSVAYLFYIDPHSAVVVPYKPPSKANN